MSTILHNDGKTILYTASTASDVNAGDIIPQGTTASNVTGVATYPIAKGETGVLSTEGAYWVDCGTATTFSVGANVYYNTTSKLATATTSDYLVGKAFRACVANDGKVLVGINK